MSRTISLLGSQWREGSFTPKLPGFFSAANVADPLFSATVTEKIYPADFTADFLRKWLYRVNELSIEVSGTWGEDGTFAGSATRQIYVIASEAAAVAAGNHIYGLPSFVDVPYVDKIGTAGTEDLFFWLGFYSVDGSSSITGTAWHSDDGTAIRHHFECGFYTGTEGYWGGTELASTLDPYGLDNVVGSLDFDGVSIPLYGVAATGITATVTPSGWWPYGGTYDPATGEPPA